MRVLIVLLVVSSYVFAEPTADVDFKVTMGPTFTASAKGVKGKVVVQNGEYVAQNIVVDLKTLTSKMDLRDDHMKNKYLEVDKYPEAVLVTGKGKDGKGVGKIKIRGVEKEIKGTYKALNDKEVEAKFDLSLADFNIKASYKGIGVKDTVNLRVVVPIERSPAAAPKAVVKPKK
ncbi:MAG: YceI family protein [Bdellovibrionaceae bacterium]|nr:YceI family protein [Pseudobdellovibrionaceae bacterium]